MAFTSDTERREALKTLQARILACRACVYPHGAVPVVAGSISARLMLVGQAPGKVEQATGQPWMGPAGRRLVGWMVKQVGFIDEAAVREHVYLAAVTRCFPGAHPSGHGDRRPGPAEIENCAPFLAEELALLRPALIFLVGGLAIERLLGKVKLSEVVGRTWPMNFGREDPFTSLLVPLPHPSGASTWLNDSTHQQQLAQGLKAARDAILAKALAPLSPHGSQPGAMDGLPYDV